MANKVGTTPAAVHYFLRHIGANRTAKRKIGLRKRASNLYNSAKVNRMILADLRKYANADWRSILESKP